MDVFLIAFVAGVVVGGSIVEAIWHRRLDRAMKD